MLFFEVVLAFVWFLSLWAWRNHKKAAWNWPLIGMLPALLLHAGRVHDVCTDVLRQTRRGTFVFKGPWFANMEIIGTVNPANVHYITSSNFVNFPKGPRFKQMFDVLGHGIFNSDSDSWRMQRQMARALITHHRFLRGLAEISYEKVEKGLVPILENAWQKEQVLDLQDVFQRLTFDTTCVLVTGYDPGCLAVDMPEIPFSKAMDDVEEAVFVRHLLPERVWKLQRWLGVGWERRLSHGRKVLDDVIGKYIAQKRDELRERERLLDDEREDCGADLLTSYIKGGGDSGNDGFLRDTVLNLMIAGRDTTSSALTWFTWLVSTHPKVESKIQDELKSLCPEQGGLFKVEDTNKMVYMHAALCEALRLYPPVPFQHKEPVGPDILPSGHYVHPKMKVMFFLYAMGRMESIWGKDCLEFKPERWISERGMIKHEPSYKYLVFNAGPRTCLGKAVAFAQMKAVAATLIHNYQVSVVQGHRVVPNCSVILYMRDGLKVSAMDAAAQLVHCGFDHLHRASPFPSSARSNYRYRRFFPSLRRNAVVRAIATEPKPSDTKPPKATPKPPPYKLVNGGSTRMQDVSQEIKRVRAQMEENEQVAILMRGLRGQNLTDTLFADDNIKLRLVEVDESSEFLPLVYDPDSIAAYWGKRPRAVATRIVQLMSVAGGFLSRLLWDLINNKIKENEVARAIELREIVTSLGPAYIKLGQALSIRPDILSPTAMTELQKLCDKVPSFPDDVAMALIEEELGQPWYNIYSELSPSPIAAASLGQVYKGRLKENGDVVAVKVQRPFVLETVTVDLFVIRNLGLVLRKFPQVSIDVVGLVDEWAARFFEELDYVNEGENGTLFAEMMRKDLPQVVVPKTYNKYTARKVLTTQWIEGEKLSQSTESDVGELVNVGVICYLKQLLDTGFFHADPHPGNLIRTPDGKLAILDFGLVTKLTDDQKYGMIEAIAHLIHRDYSAIVKDFVKLGFIPDGVNLEPILPVLAKVFDQALEGGGAKNINFQELASDLAQITFDYPFRIPPYFALIIRAIGVLEGIALVGNPDFAIVDEAYPYIAQRLLTDESPRLRTALRYTIYGKSGVFDAERFIDVMQAFENFIDAAKSGGGDNLNGRMAELGILQPQTNTLLPVFTGSAFQTQPIQTRAALGFLLSDKGNFFREFLLDEIVKGIDAISREQLVQIIAFFGIGNVTPVFSLVPSLGPFRTAALLPTITEEDKVILNNVQKIVQFLAAGSSTSSNQGVNVTQVIQELLPVLPGLSATVLPEVLSRLSSRILARVIRDTLL